MSRVTVIDLAAEAGVSRATVSLVLRESPRVKDETRLRVQSAIKKLGYVYNRAAASLRQRSSQMAAMIINDLTNPFYTELAIGIQEALEEQSYVTLMANTDEETSRQSKVTDAMREHGAAGLIVAPAKGTKASYLQELEAAGVPVVLVMRRVPGHDANLVAPDNVLGARMATEHLLDLGHRRVAFLGGVPDMVVRRDREEGYRRAIAASGLVVDERLIVNAPVSRRGGGDALSCVLAGLAEPATAALCYNDVVAFGVLAALGGKGLSPGRDFAVIGFDDVSEAASTIPPMTSVAVRPKELGQAAARALLRQVRDPAAPPEREIFAPRLIIRGTCGAVGANATAGASII